MTRHVFLTWCKRVLAALAGLACSWPVVSFMAWRPDDKRTVVFAPDEQKTRICKQGVWLIRTDEGHLALDARCTHLCCLVSWDEEAGVFRCPCHRSVYDALGGRLEGPAREDLRRLCLKRLGDGSLHVEVRV